VSFHLRLGLLCHLLYSDFSTFLPRVRYMPHLPLPLWSVHSKDIKFQWRWLVRLWPPQLWYPACFNIDSNETIASNRTKGRAIRVTGRGGPYGCKTSRLPHLLQNRLTDGGEVVSLTCRLAALYPQEDSWYSFLIRPQGQWHHQESNPGTFRLLRASNSSMINKL
jgi:hypothetical protein